MKSVTIYKLVSKLCFPNNIILFPNHWMLHHHLSKHVKINCLYICKFTSRYKTYRWSCGHCVVAYWDRKWLARDIQFVKKRFVKTSNVNRKNTSCLEYSHRALVSNFIRAFPQTCEATQQQISSVANERHECLCAQLRLIRLYLTLQDPRLIFSHCIKVKQSRYRPGVAQRFPGS